MSATYDPSLPTARDRLRLALSDTDTIAAYFPDETYDGALISCGNDENEALMVLARALQVKLSQLPTESQIGPDTHIYGNRVKGVGAIVSGGSGGGGIDLTPKRIGVARPVRD